MSFINSMLSTFRRLTIPISGTSNSNDNNNNNTSNNGSNNSNNNSGNSNRTSHRSYDKNIFIGDSKGVQICIAYLGSLALCEYNGIGSVSGNDLYITSGAKAYSWFVNTAVPDVTRTVANKNYNIFVMMGINDVAEYRSYPNSPKTDHVGNYFNKVSSLAKNEWKNQNVIFVSITPAADFNTYVYQSDINAFNNTMKTKINSANISNLSYCDISNVVNANTESPSNDGIHYYDKSTNKRIHDAMINRCLR